ncbi:hypothetical protein Tco_0819372 [Tanacetum coccineum]|uniref:Uncharacterized protein n=1 Tax=Tanacetum coccineum TaxID=301880 RepID=A0ABQ5AAM0_9ASTR
MAIGTGHRSNNYSESKRNDHLDNNRRQEQRNKGIPNKSHPNFREEHESFSSIFVSNITLGIKSLAAEQNLVVVSGLYTSVNMWGGRGVWLEFDAMDQVESVKNFKGGFKEIFLESKAVSTLLFKMKDAVWFRPGGSELGIMGSEVFKKLAVSGCGEEDVRGAGKVILWTPLEKAQIH